MARMLHAKEFYAAYPVPGKQGVLIRRWQRMLASWRMTGKLKPQSEQHPNGYYLDQSPDTYPKIRYDERCVCAAIYAMRDTNWFCILLFRHNADRIESLACSHE